MGNGNRFVHQREKRCIHQFKKRAGWKDPHHLRPLSRGGDSIQSNIINLDGYRHDAWHLLFGNLTLSEIIGLLARLNNMKDKQRFKIKL